MAFKSLAEIDEYVDERMSKASSRFDLFAITEVLAIEVLEGVTNDQVLSALRSLQPVDRVA